MKFKETKIGLVPKDWEEIVLNSFITEKKNYSNDENIPLGSLTIEQGVIEKPSQYSREHLVKNSKNPYKIIEYGDFVYNPMNLRFGALGLYKGDKPLRVSSYYNIFRIDTSIVDMDFIYYFLKSRRLLHFYNRMAIGSLEEKKRLHFKDFLQFSLPLPPLKEQQKIAKILLTCDEMIEKQEKLIKEKEKLKKGLMQKLLKVELRVEKGELKKLPKVRFKEFSGEWMEKKLGELVEEYTQKNNEEYQPVAIGIYGIRKREDIFSKSLTNNIRVNKVIFKNTLTFGLGTKQIVFGILLDNQYYSVSPAYKTFKIFSEQIVPSFLNYLLILENKKLSSKYMIISSRQGKSVNIKELLQHKFIIPPTLEEQEKIADVLSTLDKEIDLLKLELEEFKKLKKSLMQKLLTGKVRVKV